MNSKVGLPLLALAIAGLLGLAWFVFANPGERGRSADPIDLALDDPGRDGNGGRATDGGQDRSESRSPGAGEGTPSGTGRVAVERIGPGVRLVEAGTERPVEDVRVRIGADHPLRTRLAGWRSRASARDPITRWLEDAEPADVRVRHARTDVDGWAPLTIQDRGRWLSVDDPHWFAVRPTQARAERTVDRLELERGGRLRGRVIAAAPADATLRLWVVPAFGATRLGQATARGVAATAGLDAGASRTFEVGGLPADRGGYRVFLDLAGFGTAWEEVVVRPGLDTELSIEVPAGIALVGRVESGAGGPLGGAQVVLSPNVQELRARGGSPLAGFSAGTANGLEPRPLAVATSANDGTFEFRGVGDGSYALAVFAEGHAPGSVPRCLVRAGAYEPLVVVLDPASPFLGVAVGRDGTPVPGALVTVERANAGDGRGWLPPLPRVVEGVEARADAAGRFAFGSLPRRQPLRLVGRQAGLRGTLELPALEPGSAPEPMPEPARLVLVPHGNVQVHLIYATGRAASRSVRATVFTEGLPSPVAAASVVAPAVQRIDVEDVPVGSWRLLLEAEGFAAQLIPFERANVEEPLELHCELHPGATLRGRAVEEGSGRPIEGAEVAVVADWRRIAQDATALTRLEVRVRTSGDGVFVLRDLAPGTLELLGEHPDHPPARSAALEIPAGMEELETVLVFARGGMLRGTVTDRAGLPRAGVQVMASALEGDGTGLAATDERGTYTLDRLPPGSYRVTVIDRARTRQPGEAFGNRLADVRPGQVTVLDFAERAQARATLVGRVSSGGRALPAGRARVYPGVTGGAIRAPIAEGVFRVADLPLGHHRLVLDPPGASSGWGGTEFHVVLDAPGDVERAFELPGGAVAGRVLDADDRPASAWVRLQRLDADGTGEDVGARTTDAQGSFAFEHVHPGAYRLVASVTGGTRRVRSTGAPVVRSIAVAEGARVDGIELRLQSAGSALVLVEDEEGEPLAGARVRLVGRDASNQGLIGEGRTDPAGRARVRPLAPGRYAVVAVANGRGAGAGEDVVVVGGEESATSVRASAGFDVVFDVSDGDGEAIPDATIALVDGRGVEVAAFPGRELRLAGPHQLDGAYPLGKVAPGSYRADVRCPRTGARAAFDLVITADVRRRVVLDAR